MMFQAVLGNPGHPEYGVATIPFPIPHDQYAHCMELLEALEIGDAVKADCKVEKVDSFYTVLKRAEMLTVNRANGYVAVCIEPDGGCATMLFFEKWSDHHHAAMQAQLLAGHDIQAG